MLKYVTYTNCTKIVFQKNFMVHKTLLWSNSIYHKSPLKNNFSVIIILLVLRLDTQEINIAVKSLSSIKVN